MDQRRDALRQLGADLAEQRAAEEREAEEQAQKRQIMGEGGLKENGARAGGEKLNLLSFFKRKAPQKESEMIDGNDGPADGAASASAAPEAVPMSWAIALNVDAETAALQSEVQAEANRQSAWAVVLSEETQAAADRERAEAARAVVELNEQDPPRAPARC